MLLYDAHSINCGDEESQVLTAIISRILIKGINDLESSDDCITFYNDHLPSQMGERFKVLLGFYDSSLGSSYLRSVTVLMLASTSKSAQYNTKLFSHPLDKQSVWKEKQILGTFQVNDNPGVIRATQNLMQFTQTQASQIEQESYLPPKKLKTNSGMSQGISRRPFSYSEIALSQHRRKRKAEHHAPRLIKLVRVYRSGEIPDIQIGYKDVILPIIKLVLSNDEFAYTLLSEVVKLLALPDIEQPLYQVLYKTNDPILAKFFMELGIHLQISPDMNFVSPATLAAKYHLSYLGILWAETALSVSHEANLWKDICQTYQTVNEYDTVLGIRRYHLTTSDSHYEGLDAMSKGDYEGALACFKSCPNRTETIQDQLDCMLMLGRWSEIDDVIAGTIVSNQAMFGITSSIHDASKCNIDNLKRISDGIAQSYNGVSLLKYL